MLRACFKSSFALSRPAPPLQAQFARISLLAEVGDMAQHGDSVGLMDIKKNLRHLYELLSISVMDNREMAKVVNKMEDTVNYTSLQISNHDSRIDDNESNIRELLGKVDRIQEDLQRFMAMNQNSRVYGDTTEAVHPMEEESVAQPRNIGGNH